MCLLGCLLAFPLFKSYLSRKVKYLHSVPPPASAGCLGAPCFHNGPLLRHLPLLWSVEHGFHRCSLLEVLLLVLVIPESKPDVGNPTFKRLSWLGSGGLLLSISVLSLCLPECGPLRSMGRDVQLLFGSVKLLLYP